MYAPRLRLLCSAASLAAKSQLAPRTRRFFHPSSIARARDDGNNGPGDEGKPADNEDRPEKNNGTDKELANGQENGNLEIGGRRTRRGNGSKSRSTRSKADELPAVAIPEGFKKAVVRFYDSRLDPADSDQNESSDAWEALVTRMSDNHNGFREEAWNILSAASWSKDNIGDVLNDIRIGNIQSTYQRSKILPAAAYWYIQSAARSMQDGVDGMPEQLASLTHAPPSQSFFATLRHADVLAEDSFKSPRHYQRAVERVAPCGSTAPKPIGDGFDTFEEMVAAVRADFSIDAPKSPKSNDIRRRVSIFDFDFDKSFQTSCRSVEAIASIVQADVINIDASDIARIIGPYLGQDVARAPGKMSLLGFTAAENAGSLRRRDELSEQDGSIFADNLFSDRSKRETKRSFILFDDYFNQANRGKNDELWEDLKINAALEDMVRVADVDGLGARPLIVHVHDIVALSMDAECGANVVNRLRKVVDNMWLQGRKVVLVGTSSSKHVSPAYLRKLDELSSSERVIIAHRDEVSGDKAAEEISNATQNEANIRFMLSTLIGSDPDNKNVIKPLRLAWLHEAKKVPISWVKQVLPHAEVYRIATTMIGLHRHRPKVFGRELMEETAALIKRIDASKAEWQFEMLVDVRDGSARGASPRGVMSDIMKLDPRNEDHEENLLSGLVNAKDIKTTFDDVHAPSDTIESVKMLTTLALVRPEAFSYGVLANDRIPGCLLYGPPGTGKTLLAKAIAKQSGANMIEVSGASINNMWVGESEKNVRALFRLAKKMAPMVIFIDEADALLGARSGRSHSNKRDTINQFLREWDGMDQMNAFIMVATNRPFDLDEAVLRRLPRKLLIDLPLEQDRVVILRIHLKGETLDDTVSLENIAKETPLYSGSDLKNVCVAAAMAAVKEEMVQAEKYTGTEPYVWPVKRVLSRRHFDKALKEISASVSEDMQTLAAIRKFDERYGDGRGKRKRRGIGFDVLPDPKDSDEARVRKTSGR